MQPKPAVARPIKRDQKEVGEPAEGEGGLFGRERLTAVRRLLRGDGLLVDGRVRRLIGSRSAG